MILVRASVRRERGGVPNCGVMKVTKFDPIPIRLGTPSPTTLRSSKDAAANRSITPAELAVVKELFHRRMMQIKKQAMLSDAAKIRRRSSYGESVLLPGTRSVPTKVKS